MSQQDHQLNHIPHVEHQWLRYFTEHRLAANLIMILVIIAGIAAANKLHTQVFPDVDIPGLEFSVSWAGANAENLERDVVSVLEQQVLALEHIDRVESFSNNGSASIQVRYLFDTDMAEAKTNLQNLLDSFDLPDGAEFNRINQWQFKEQVMDLLFISQGPIDELRPLLAEYREQLLGLGVPEVHVQGLPDQDLKVAIPTSTLLSLETTIGEIANQITTANQNVSAGSVGENFNQKSISSYEKSDQLLGVSNTLITTNNGQNVELSQIADIALEARDGQRKIFYKGQQVGRLRMYRSKDVDSIQTSNIVRDWMNSIEDTKPESLDIELYWDVSEFVKGNVQLMVNNGLMGLVFVILTLFVFLNARVAFWTAVGIPISILGALVFLQWTGGSLNFFSIFAMLMATGIIVDDAIVVGEESLTQLQKGKDPVEAANLGAIRMFGPVIASSLTTIAAFSPLLFLPGHFGQLLLPIPVVIISVIVASLIECFLILPGHLNHSFHRGKQKKPGKLRTAIDQGFARFRENKFRNWITWAIEYRGITISLAIAFFALAIAMLSSGTIKFAGDIDAEDDSVSAWAVFVEGTPESEIVAFNRELAAALERADAHFAPNEKLVKDVINIFDESGRYTYLEAQLTPRDERSVSNNEFLQYWDEQVNRQPGLEEINIGEGESESAGQTFSVSLVGDNIDVLRLAVDDLSRQLKSYSELKNVTDNLADGRQEFIYQVNAAGRQLGVTPQWVSQQIRASLNGVPIQTFVRHGQDQRLVVGLPKAETARLDVLVQMPIRTPQGQVVPLGHVVDLNTGSALATIYHENGDTGVTISADYVVPDGDFREFSNEMFESHVASVMQKYGLKAEFRGSMQDMQELFRNLTISALVAICLMYLILAWVFASYSWPIAVMSAIPLGFTGAVFGHWALGMDFTPLSIFGCFGLSGIIVNDSIILIGRYRELRLGGMEIKPAIVEASCQRLRAVFLTSITTVMGLVPILMETSVQAQLVQSMAASLAFGIAYGTILVLVVIPSVLTIIESVNASIHNLKSWFRSRTKSRQTA